MCYLANKIRSKQAFDLAAADRSHPGMPCRSLSVNRTNRADPICEDSHATRQPVRGPVGTSLRAACVGTAVKAAALCSPLPRVRGPLMPAQPTLATAMAVSHRRAMTGSRAAMMEVAGRSGDRAMDRWAGFDVASATR